MPHYIHYSTQKETLSVLRTLLRQIRRLPVPFVRDHLCHMTMHSFHGYKHISEPHKIEALIAIARQDTELVSSALGHNHRDLETVLNRSLRTFGVKNSPFYRVMKPSLGRHHETMLISSQTTSQQNLHKQLLEAGVTVPKTVAYRFNNLDTPPVSSVADHYRLRTLGQHDFYKFVEFLKKNGVSTGHSDRKLFFEPVLAYTPLGTPVALCRQKNHVKKVYAKLLRDSYRPVHPDIIDFVDKARQDYTLGRIYRRRFELFAEKSFSVNEDMQRIRSSLWQR